MLGLLHRPASILRGLVLLTVVSAVFWKGAHASTTGGNKCDWTDLLCLQRVVENATSAFLDVTEDAAERAFDVAASTGSEAGRLADAFVDASAAALKRTQLDLSVQIEQVESDLEAQVGCALSDEACLRRVGEVTGAAAVARIEQLLSSLCLLYTSPSPRDS